MQRMSKATPGRNQSALHRIAHALDPTRPVVGALVLVAMVAWSLFGPRVELAYEWRSPEWVPWMAHVRLALATGIAVGALLLNRRRRGLPPI